MNKNTPQRIGVLLQCEVNSIRESYLPLFYHKTKTNGEKFMNLEKIKKSSKELNQAASSIELIKNHFSLLSATVSKEASVKEKAMALYIALESDGSLSIIENLLNDVVDKVIESEMVLFKIAESKEPFVVGGKL